MKKLFMALSAATLLCLLAFPVQAARLDGHDGMMKITSANIMAYQNSNLTGQLNHYIVAGDWYNIIGNGSGSVQLHYPITIANGKGDATETHYFNKTDWATNCDGAAGTFTEGWDQTAWYNALPRSGVTYTDNCPDNNPQLYVSNNTGFNIVAGQNGNSKLLCGGVTVLGPTSAPATKCYYAPADWFDADWGWVQKSQAWSTAGLIQGTNTVYCAGSDASGNYATASYTFKFDNVAPYCTSTAIKNVSSTGYDVYVYGVADATSGVKKVMVPTWTTPNQSNIQWLQATSQGGGTYICHISAGSFGGATKGYTSDVYIYDNAGNWGRYHTNTSNLTPPVGNPSYYPTADFEATSPVLMSQTITYTDLSTSGSSSDTIDQEQWSYSSDGKSTWSADASTPPSFFLSTGTYYVRLRVHDKTANIWSDYCVREIDVISVATKPTADFTVQSPVPTNAFVAYQNLSHVDPNAASWDTITDQEWSYSADKGATWSAPSSSPPLTYNLSEFSADTLYATYYIRLRVKDAGNEYQPGIWSDYCIDQLVVYRPNTPPSALFNINSQYYGLDPSDKLVSYVANGFYNGTQITYVEMQNGSVKQLLQDDDIPAAASSFDDAKKIVVDQLGYVYALKSDGSLLVENLATGNIYAQGLSGVSDIAASDKTAYAIMSDGSVKVQNVQTGSSTTAWTSVNITDVKTIVLDSAYGNTYALKSNGYIYYWNDYNSQFTNFSSTAGVSHVPSNGNVKDIAFGKIGNGSDPNDFCYGLITLNNDNSITCVDFHRVYGSGYIVHNISSTATLTHIYAGKFLYALSADGSLYTFINKYDTVSEANNNTIATDHATENQLCKISGISDVKQLDVSNYDDSLNQMDTLFAVGSTGIIKTFGYNQQSGSVLPTSNNAASSYNQSLPSDIPYFMDSYPVSISAGGAAAIVKMSDGTYKTFGSNDCHHVGYVDNSAPSIDFGIPVSTSFYAYNGSVPDIYLSTSNPGGQAALSTMERFSAFSKISDESIQTINLCDGYVLTKDGTLYEQNDFMEADNGAVREGFYANGPSVYKESDVSKEVTLTNNDHLLLMRNGTIKVYGSSLFFNLSFIQSYQTSAFKYGDNSPGVYTFQGKIGYLKPVSVSGIQGIADIATVSQNMYLLTNAGHVLTLSFNSSKGSFSTTDIGVADAISLYSADNYLLILKSDGSVSQYDGSTVATLPLQNIMQISGSTNFALALDSEGNVYSWGDGSSGELGRSYTTSDESTPSIIPSLQNVSSIAAGDKSAYALTNDHELYAWGDNSSGQLGCGDTITSGLPMLIPYFSYSYAIPAVFPQDSITYTDLSNANDYWDSLNSKVWQWSWDNATWTDGHPDSLTWDDLNGQKERVLYIREQVSDVGNPPYSPGMTSKWFILRVLLVDPRPQNGSLHITKSDYKADNTDYWIKANSQVGIYSDGSFPSNLLFSPSRLYVGFGQDGVYCDGVSASQYANTTGHYNLGTDYNRYFNFVNDGASAVSQGNLLFANQNISGKLDATSFELYYNTSFVDSISGKEYSSQEGYRNSGQWIHVDGRAPTGSAVITLAGNAASAVVSNVTDNNGSGTKILYAEIFDDGSGTKVNLQTVNLTTSDGGSTWKLPTTSTVGIGSMSNIEIDIYAEDNVGNIGMVGSFKNGSMTTGNLSGTLVLSSHYYENTDVTGAVNVNYTNTDPTANLTPSSGVTLRVTAGSQVVTKTVLCPANNTSYIPFTFHTPSVPAGSSQPLTVSAQIDPDHVMPETDYADNNVSQQVTIDSAAYTEPPTTTYQPDIPSTFQNISPGNYPSTNSFSWQEWRYENSALVLKTFSVNVSSAMQLTPDSRIGSNKLGSDGIWTIRSGYGFGDTTAVHVTTNYDQPDLITLPQRIRVYFPEFNYDMQNNLRELEKTLQTGTASDYTVTYQLKQNPQSDILARLHFTPLWFPNSSYAVLENVRDLWTPAGQINMWGASQLNISGSVYDDWYTGLIKNQT